MGRVGFVQRKVQLGGKAHSPQQAHGIAGEALDADRPQPPPAQVFHPAAAVHQSGWGLLAQFQGQGVDSKVAQGQVCGQITPQRGQIADQPVWADDAGHIPFRVQGIVGPAQPVGGLPSYGQHWAAQGQVQVRHAPISAQKKVPHGAADDVNRFLLGQQGCQQRVKAGGAPKLFVVHASPVPQRT